MSRVAIAGLLLVAACAAPVTTSPVASPSTSQPSRDQPLLVTTPCADLVVLGARGSQQSPDHNFGVGREVRRSVEAMARLLHERSTATVRIEQVPYDSSGAAYSQDVVDGARLTMARLTDLAAACPDSRLGLVGFSEGAQVIHGAILDVPADLARRIAVAAMISDPRRNPDDAIEHWTYGTRPTRPGRLGAGTPVDVDVRGAAISLCVADDEICNAHGPPGASPSTTHREFYEQPDTARSTAEQLDSVLRRREL